MLRTINKIFVLNIRMDIDTITNKLSELDLPYEDPYEIKHGVVGRNTDVPFKCWDKWELPQSERHMDWWCRPMTDGEVGCSMSHWNAWRQAYDEGHEWVLFLEEDFKRLRSCNDLDLNTFDDNVDGFYLGSTKMNHKSKDVPYNDTWMIPCFRYNTHAYCMSRSGIKKLLDTNFNMRLLPTDEFLGSTYAPHEREDVLKEFPPFLNMITPQEDYIEQLSEEWNSMTEDIGKHTKQFEYYIGTEEYKKKNNGN